MQLYIKYCFCNILGNYVIVLHRYFIMNAYISDTIKGLPNWTASMEYINSVGANFVIKYFLLFTWHVIIYY